MIGVKTSGSFSHFEDFAKRVLKGDIYADLSRFGQQGVDALSNATPEETGETADSWGFKIVKGKKGKPFGIYWFNNHVVDDQIIAVLIQYGHGTGTGGYVEGRDYINPAIQPIFDLIAEAVWKEVSK